MTSKVITRFAPSPTGLLHIGNVRTALIAWLYARSHNGKFILRIDDTDSARSTQQFINEIKRDLEWLGLDWDDYFHQSDRTERYIEVCENLLNDGRLYKCYESAEELDIKRKISLNAGKPPIYDRAALKLSQDDVAALEAAGHKHHLRFKLNDGVIEWDDMVRGHLKFEAHNLSDPIWVREDGTITYSIASVIDDADYNITDIIRGSDHISNSAMHIQLFEAIGATIPRFGHLSLLQSAHSKISKRLGGFTIKDIRESGIEPETVLSLLARLGTSDPVVPVTNIEELVATFSITKMGKAPVYYDSEELNKLNSNILHALTYEQASRRLPYSISYELWHGIKNNLNKLRDVQVWTNICLNDNVWFESLQLTIVENNIEGIESIITAALKCIPDGEFDSQTWSKWVPHIKKFTTKSGKNLFMPLRICITGLAKGPELDGLLPIIGRERTMFRLQYMLHKLEKHI